MSGKPRPPKKMAVKKAAPQSISIHTNLSEALASFLKKEKLQGNETKQALTSLIAVLSDYREEGQRLFPEIFIFDDVSNILQTLPNSERVVIGSGRQAPATLGIALKRCAPLAQWGWSIYVLRTAATFEYGLLRCGHSALSLTASDLLIEQGDESLPALLIRHISYHTIEICGACGNSIRIHFGAVEHAGEDPLVAITELCGSIIMNVPANLQEQVRNFYFRVFAGVLRSGHGCLAAVLQGKVKQLPLQFRDGVVIRPALDVTEKVGSLLKTNDCESDTRLRATAALIRGMLCTDGLTLLRSDGSVPAYNIFIRSEKEIGKEVVAFGGARRRAFKTLCSWLGSDLRSAFFLSQDGHAEFQGK